MNKNKLKKEVIEISDEQILLVINYIYGSLLKRFPQLIHKEQEIRSAANGGVAMALKEYNSSRGYRENILDYIQVVGKNRAIDILRSPSERLVDVGKRFKSKKCYVINETDYFWKYSNTLDHFPEKGKKTSEQEAIVEMSKFVKDAIQDAPDDYKEVFNHFYIEGNSGREVAEIMDIKWKRVQYINHRLIKIIKNFFDANGEEYPIVFNTFGKGKNNG